MRRRSGRQTQVLRHKRLQLATAFSGIGAIEHALDRLGIKYDIVFATDNDRFAKQSYFANYRINEDRWYDDVHDIDGRRYKDKVDLLVGGSPCQSFSTVGDRDGMGDLRGTLIYTFVRLIGDSKPRAFIFENVKGLRTHDSGRTWKRVESRFAKLGYSIKCTTMNAKDYGLPQHRERLFVVGFRKKGIRFSFPNPVKLTVSMSDMLEDTPNRRTFVKGKSKFVAAKRSGGASWRRRRPGDFKISPKRRVDPKYTLLPKTKKYVLASGTKNFKCVPKTDLDVARPILATLHKMHRAGVDNYVTRGRNIRRLTPRECMRLMGFDDSYKIVVSDVQAYRQSGNSIAVNVLMELIRSMGGDWLKS